MADLKEFHEALNLIVPTLSEGEIYAEHDLILIRGHKANPSVALTAEQMERLSELCFFPEDKGQRMQWVRYT